MARKKSAHLTRILVEGLSTYSAYKASKLGYARERDPIPQISLDLVTKMDLERAIKILYERGELSEQEIKMLAYVSLDGRLSRRDISAMIQEQEGIYVDQRTISRKLESAYYKIAKFLGWEYSDSRVFQMIAKKKQYPEPYILSDDEIDEAQQIFERV